jgi:glycosyltransferase involved in cell wall biosynthesis
MKILLSAYACEPNCGSEPGVGWNMAQKLAQYHQVWVLTSNTHRAAITAELNAHPIANLQMVYFDPFGWVYDWSLEGKRSQWSVYFHYYFWQVLAYFVGRRLHQQVIFNVVHHSTYVKYSNPSFLALLPVPFVWGPVGGGEQAPKEFWQDFGWRGKLYEHLRNLARQIGELDPFVRMTARRSRVAIATTADTAQCLKKLHANNVHIIPGIGLSSSEIQELEQLHLANSQEIRFISIGRLLHWKGFHLGLQAFAKARLSHSEYWILGEGPEQKRLQELAQTLGISKQVRFLGRLPRQACLAKLGQCHVMVHPSLHDSGGLVCLEAMAARRPIICLNLGGPGVQVTTDAGYKIPANNPEQVVQQIAVAMKTLANNTDLRRRMGQAGQQVVREQYNWDRKILTQIKLYEQILDQSKPLALAKL